MYLARGEKMNSLIKCLVPLLFMYACIKSEPPKKEDYLSNFGKELTVLGSTYDTKDWNNDGNIDALTDNGKCYAYDTNQELKDEVQNYLGIYESTLRLGERDFELINALTKKQRDWLYQWDSLIYEAKEKHKNN
jgi:hypothetical protein